MQMWRQDGVAVGQNLMLCFCGYILGYFEGETSCRVTLIINSEHRRTHEGVFQSYIMMYKYLLGWKEENTEISVTIVCCEHVRNMFACNAEQAAN